MAERDDRIERLQCELAQITKERDLLKEVAAYFAKEARRRNGE